MTAAGIGDMCVILAPHVVPEGVRHYQAELRERFGGSPVELVHLTLLRSPPARLVPGLRDLVPHCGRFAVEITGLFTIYSESRQLMVVKAKAVDSVETQTWRARLRELARAAGVVPYDDLPWPTVTLLTAAASSAMSMPMVPPGLFFSVERLLLTKITGREQYETILELDIPSDVTARSDGADGTEGDAGHGRVLGSRPVLRQ